jgi:hypothetical protein
MPCHGKSAPVAAIPIVLTGPSVMPESRSAMKKIAIFAAVFVFILVLTKIANQMPPEQAPGYSFWIYAQHVVACSPTEIKLVDNHQTETQFEKDASWPACSAFHKDDVLDFHLSRGERTRFLSDEATAWWRKAM